MADGTSVDPLKVADPGEDAEQEEVTTFRRTLSPVAAWALSLGCTIGWGSFVMPGRTFLPAAGPAGTAIAFLVGALAMLVIAVNYGYMAKRYPGEGGAYAYAHATFGANSAFIGSWCLVLGYCAAIVSNAMALALLARSVLGPYLQVGFHYVIADYDVYFGEAALGAVAIVLAGLLCGRSTRATAWVVTVLAIGMVAGIVVIVAMLLAKPDVTFQSLEPLYSPHHKPLAGMMIVLALVPWAYIGFESVTQVSAECHFPAEKLRRLMLSAILIGTVIYVVLNTVAAALVPDGCDSWVSYVDKLDSYEGVSAVPTFNAASRIAGRLGVVTMSLSALCAVLSCVVGFSMAATRLIRAMAADGALPQRFARLHPSYGTPVLATTFVVVTTMVVPFMGRNVLDWITDLMSVGALIAYAYTSLAVVRHARTCGNRLMVATGMAGMAISILCVSLLVVPIPELGTSMSKETYILLLAWIGLGVNSYNPTSVRY